MNVLADLEARELVHDRTDLAARLDAGPITLYLGFDPTADSLHAGHLVGALALRRFLDHGHRPLALVGGATGMVGDPSGRSEERNLLDEETLAHNVAAIRAQLQPLLPDIEFVNNLDWTRDVGVIEFLRDVGKHATVNQMIAKESVRSRMDGEHGISYTEFSYMLLQAHDYWWLNKEHDCELQIGGSDQWGNITAGIDMIRRRSDRAAHGLTWPLVTRSDGAKFGKSSGDNVWLSPERTSPYRFYQYWMQIDDRDVRRFLAQLTLLPVAEVDGVAAAHLEAPERREGQRRLAREVTALLHGAGAAAAAEEASGVLFGTPLDDVTEAALEAVAGEVPTTALAAAAELDLVAVLVATGLAASKGDARRGLGEGSVYVNNVRRTADEPLGTADVRFGRYVLLRRGKRNQHLLVLDG